MSSLPGRTSPAASDAELLAQVCAGDPDAFEALYDRYGSYALGVAHRVLSDRGEAEEVVQDVFVQLWKAPQRFDERRGKLSTWLFVLARNRAVDRLRRRGSRPQGEPPDARQAAGDPDAVSLLLQGERRQTVLDALLQLSTAQRETLELAFYRGLTQSEIAAETGEPLGTVKSRMSRAMAALRVALEGRA
ncbi:MAG TPA: sigma-70 family RNA polymerase sigma factor [Myxococcota bacterium]|jgi:RNA polymerase sigma-70 factor (ECF subfamily)|nr:sigma-70 family RNA polymerase sigma factor [Myxococcota bacterium]